MNKLYGRKQQQQQQITIVIIESIHLFFPLTKMFTINSNTNSIQQQQKNGMVFASKPFIHSFIILAIFFRTLLYNNINILKKKNYLMEFQ